MLVVTSLDDVTADQVIQALNLRRVPVVRADPADIGPVRAGSGGLIFSARIDGTGQRWAGRLRTASRALDLGKIRSVYHRRPGPWRFDHLRPEVRDFASREARYGVTGLLAHLPVLHVNAPAATACADYKPAQLQTAARLGFPVPVTLITNDVHEARTFADDHAPVVYKSFRGVPPEDGVSGAIWTQRVSAAELDETIAHTAHMFQAEIDKASDLRITVVGDRVFASAITAPDDPLDWRSADWSTLTYDPFEVPGSLADLLRAYLDYFGLVFGCFDFALERGSERPVFIECNPNGQWGFLPDSELIADAFAALLQAG